VRRDCVLCSGDLAAALAAERCRDEKDEPGFENSNPTPPWKRYLGLAWETSGGASEGRVGRGVLANGPVRGLVPKTVSPQNRHYLRLL
jgi:hypothetical protein